MTIKQLQKQSHKIAVEKGFWGDVCICKYPILEKGFNGEYVPLCMRCLKGTNKFGNDGEKIALMHSKLSEALQALRKGNPRSKKIPKFSSVEEEFADCIIRIFDTAEKKEYDIEGAIKAKLKYNKKRPYKHGKEF